MATKTRLRWKKIAGTPGVHAPLSCAGDYVISHRFEEYTLSYRPEGQHHPLGSYKTLAAAKERARRHAGEPRRGALVPDVTVTAYGPIWMLCPNTDAAHDWVAEHLPADAPRWGTSVAVEVKFVSDILSGMQAAGLTLG